VVISWQRGCDPQPVGVDSLVAEAAMHCANYEITVPGFYADIVDWHPVAVNVGGDVSVAVLADFELGTGPDLHQPPGRAIKSDVERGNLTIRTMRDV
jgi:hypothetical protein